MLEATPAVSPKHTSPPRSTFTSPFRHAIETTRLVEGLVMAPRLPQGDKTVDTRPASLLSRLRPALLLLVCVVGVGATGAILIHTYQRGLLRACEWMQQHAPASLLVYAAVTVLWILGCLPATIMEVTAGFIYGFYVAFPAMLVAKVLACCLAFLLGRCVAGNSVQETLASSCSLRARALVLAMHKHPWKITMLLRLCYLPIAVKNYGMALLPCPLHVYVVCTFVTALIYTPLLTHLGASSRTLLSATKGTGAQPTEIALLCLSVGVLVVLVGVLRRLSNRYLELAEQEEEGTIATAIDVEEQEHSPRSSEEDMVAFGRRQSGQGEEEVEVDGEGRLRGASEQRMAGFDGFSGPCINTKPILAPRDGLGTYQVMV